MPLVLDKLISALDHELEAADFAEVGSAALGVRPTPFPRGRHEKKARFGGFERNAD